MTTFEAVLLGLAYLLLVAVAAWAGYLYGHEHGYRAAEEDQERLRRIDPPDRTPGMPTNLGVPPSRVTLARRRGGRVHDIPTKRGEPRR